MSIVATYTREQWEHIGEFTGVQDYIGGVELLFFDYYDEDEDTEEERTVKDYPERGVRAIMTKALRPYRFYERDDEQSHVWQFITEGKREVSNTLLIGLPETDGVSA